MDAIVRAVTNSARNALAHPACVSWFATQKVASGDLILVNNSFVFREVKTAKSDLYLAFSITKNGKPASAAQVATGLKINSDFRLMSRRPATSPL